MKFILLVIVKMPTIVGILTFISMMNFHEELKFHVQLSWIWKKFYNLRARAKKIKPKMVTQSYNLRWAIILLVYALTLPAAKP